MKHVIAICTLLIATGVAGQAPGYVPPAGKAAPKVGQTAPDFTLPDTAGKPVKLTELLAQPASGAKSESRAGAWVLLIFYRGYW